MRHQTRTLSYFSFPSLAILLHLTRNLLLVGVPSPPPPSSPLSLSSSRRPHADFPGDNQYELISKPYVRTNPMSATEKASFAKMSPVRVLDKSEVIPKTLDI